MAASVAGAGAGSGAANTTGFLGGCRSAETSALQLANHFAVAMLSCAVMRAAPTSSRRQSPTRIRVALACAMREVATTTPARNRWRG
jgi:hypothetical protein